MKLQMSNETRELIVKQANIQFVHDGGSHSFGSHFPWLKLNPTNSNSNGIFTINLVTLTKFSVHGSWISDALNQMSELDRSKPNYRCTIRSVRVMESNNLNPAGFNQSHETRVSTNLQCQDQTLVLIQLKVSDALLDQQMRKGMDDSNRVHQASFICEEERKVDASGQQVRQLHLHQ